MRILLRFASIVLCVKSKFEVKDENGLGQQSVPQTANRVTHLTSLAVDIHYNKTFWKLTRTIVYLRWMEKVARPQKFNFWRQKRAVPEQFFVICGQTSWSNPLKKFLYLLWTSAGLAFQSELCSFKALAEVQRQKPKMPSILYIYR